jgi:hypothetical protein
MKISRKTTTGCDVTKGRTTEAMAMHEGKKAVRQTAAPLTHRACRPVAPLGTQTKGRFYNGDCN